MEEKACSLNNPVTAMNCALHIICALVVCSEIIICKCNDYHIYSIILMSKIFSVGAQLTVWFNGMRTRYGRLSGTSKKSGIGKASSLSTRDQ